MRFDELSGLQWDILHHLVWARAEPDFARIVQPRLDPRQTKSESERVAKWRSVTSLVARGLVSRLPDGSLKLLVMPRDVLQAAIRLEPKTINLPQLIRLVKKSERRDRADEWERQRIARRDTPNRTAIRRHTANV